MSKTKGRKIKRLTLCQVSFIEIRDTTSRKPLNRDESFHVLPDPVITTLDNGNTFRAIIKDKDRSAYLDWAKANGYEYKGDE